MKKEYQYKFIYLYLCEYMFVIKLLLVVIYIYRDYLNGHSFEKKRIVIDKDIYIYNIL